MKEVKTLSVQKITFFGSFFIGIYSAITVLLPANAATITSRWISKDKSIALLHLAGGEQVLLPLKGGGTTTVSCGGVACSITLKDFKDKKGNITYNTNLAGLQNVFGTIDSGTGRFEIEVAGNLEGLFGNSVVTADLTNSTGINATIGTPGDQLSQEGTISFSTQWFSDKPIGVDPLTGKEIILGEFFLDSTDPLTAFEYTVTNPDVPLISSTFTIGEKYRFSSGLEITGSVTKEFKTAVPEPSSTLGFLAIGTLCAASTLKRKLKPSKSIELLRNTFSRGGN